MSKRSVSALPDVIAAGGLIVWAVHFGVAAIGLTPMSVVEAVFLIAPLVLVPLRLTILEPTTLAARLARLLVPVGAGLLLASFWLSAGRAAGALSAGWVLTCLLLAAHGVVCLARGEFRSVQGVATNLAFVFLFVGSVWLVLYRLGAAPFDYPPALVFLAGVHFHFSAFLLPTILGLTARLRQGNRVSWPAAVCVATFAGPIALAVGNVRRSVEIKTAGAFLLVAAACGLAVLAFTVGSGFRTKYARALLPVWVVSLLAGMTLVAIFALGELLGQRWLNVETMGVTHGPLNAIGFALCALLAFRLEQSRSVPVSDVSTGSRRAG